MNQLEHLKATAMEMSRNFIYLLRDSGYDVPESARVELDHKAKHLVEHTHTQTIQSVRERVENRKRDASLKTQRNGSLACSFCGCQEECGCADYNEALEDLLKDLEAPKEGD